MQSKTTDMKKYTIVQMLLRMLLIMAGACVTGVLLLLAVFILPTQPMKAHVEKNMAAMYAEGTYTEFMPSVMVRMHPDNISVETFFLNNRGMARDNYTDAIMLGNAVYAQEKQTTLFDRAMSVYRASSQENSPLDSLKDYMTGKGGEKITSYPRYWHGYLVVLKPLLLVMTYFQIKIFNVFAELFLTVLLMCGIYRRISGKAAIAFVFAALLTFPVVIPLCLQYSTMIYVMLIASNILLYGKRDWMENYRYLYFFFVTGIVTSYVDFLTYPIISLGIPMLLLLAISAGMKQKEQIKAVLFCSVFWGIGYGVFWAMKWVIATAFSSTNVIADALGQAAHRTYGSSDATASRVSGIKSIAANLCCYSNVIYLVIILLFLIWVSLECRRQKQSLHSILRNHMAYLLTALMPLVWYAVLSEHSYDHSSFTYRGMMVSFLAVGMVAASHKTQQEEKING